MHVHMEAQSDSVLYTLSLLDPEITNSARLALPGLLGYRTATTPPGLYVGAEVGIPILILYSKCFTRRPICLAHHQAC